MSTTFLIHYPTAFGQQVEIVCNGSARSLEWVGEGWWRGELDLGDAAEYRYRVVAGPQVVAEEPTPYRSPARDVATIIDRWRYEDPIRLSRGSALFTRTIATRHGPSSAPGAGAIRFRLQEPWIPPGTRPAVLGSADALGAWNPEQAQVMAPVSFPWWELTIDGVIDYADYKYVLFDEDGALLRWESGYDRTLPAQLGEGTVVHDDEFRGLTPWRGAGVAIPVFSLRTERGVGVGQFSDLVPFAEWAAAVGLSVVQLLPVNDTMLTNGWDDSYPYNPVSVRALHPLYFDLEAIEHHGISAGIASARAELNDLDEIDYVAVMARKTELLRTAYEDLCDRLDSDSEFATFVDAEWDWLGPYSVWCHLRDTKGGDPSEWGRPAAYDADVMSAMADPASSEYDALRFYWFVQYHLHRQLNEAADRARALGVALKGDLPIGVAPQSAEVWAHPELFNLGTQTGAPPDAFATHGQNWGFPTYNWPKMAESDYAWWRARLEAFAAYVDVYRIDHVLGFFRIWEIPGDGFDGLLGRFRPADPLREREVRRAIGNVELSDFAEPWVEDTVIGSFEEHADLVRGAFFAEKPLRLQPNSQWAIREAIAGGVLGDLDPAARAAIERRLLDIAADVMLIGWDGGFSPAIDWTRSTAYSQLDPAQRVRFDALANDFFHVRHSTMWEAQGRETLPTVVSATNLLACGEDLGMVPEVVPRLMNELGLLALEIERMPKRLGEWIADPAAAPYLSVVSPSTHDTSTLRQWWAEDAELTRRYWSEALGQLGEPLAEATPEIVQAILKRQLASPAMLCIIPISDLLAIDSTLRRADVDAERINDPADRHNKWRYRLHVSIDELAAAADFNDEVRSLVAAAGRGWR